VDKKVTSDYAHFLDKENHEIVNEAFSVVKAASCGQR